MTTHYNKSEAGLTFECPTYENIKPKWYSGIIQFVKDCIPQ